MSLKDENRKGALLLHYIGDAVYDIYEAEKGDSADTYEATKHVLTSYFEPKRNIQMDIFNVRSCKQKPNQSIDDFVNTLRKLAKNCNFTKTDAEILSQVIQLCKSSRLQKKSPSWTWQNTKRTSRVRPITWNGRQASRCDQRWSCKRKQKSKISKKNKLAKAWLT